jgi:glutamate-1-semialdehyde aminotransferase/CMP-N-acetylneuraminic acid synthetase
MAGVSLKKNKIVAIVQARCDSIRLPNKIMRKIAGIPAIELLYNRLSLSKELDKIVIATSKNGANKKLISFCKKKQIDYFLGSENNVLKRYFDACKIFKADIIVRITGDSILIDPRLVDKIIKLFKINKVDYVSNCEPPTFPDGLDVEVFSKKCLEKTYKQVKKEYDKEHVTSYIKSSKKFKTINYKSNIDYSNIRWSLDQKEDLEEISLIAKHFNTNTYFSWKDILKVTEAKKNKFYKNSQIKRNEGAEMSKTQKLWKRAKQIIPGGNMLLSKRPELFLPNRWPAYFSKSKGCHVWDLDKKKYIDISLMGVGTNILGYANSKIDNTVKKVLKSGNLTTLNCPEEVQLSEKLLELHPWAQKVRLFRAGGEASAASIRIARAATGRSKIAFCGYHGWHDWYLAANIKDKKNLSTHLMPGLNPKGVPKELKNTSIPFEYNNFEQLEKISKNNELAAIKMEVQRNFPPKKNFLKKIRKLCDKKGIVLIFDECTSGFRETNGGLHKKYNVEPDIAWFGKAMGNGYAITAIIGKDSVMDSAQDSFISSTFWTERIGPTAAIKTLDEMEKIKSWEIITKIGKKIRKNWEDIAKRNGINIQISGIPALSSFAINSSDWIKYKTFITQEMLKSNILASNAIFVCTKHDKKILDLYFDKLDEIFKKIEKFENKSINIDNELETDVSQTGFKRLN